MNKLSSEEREILEAFEKGKLKRSKKAANTQKRHQEYAEAMFKKDARINIAIAAVLRYLTGQDIGGYILSDEDIAAWEEWWGQNQSAIVNGS